MNMADVRKKFPMYSDLSDDELLDGLHKKFYSDMSMDDFKQRVGVVATPEPGAGYEQAAAETGKGEAALVGAGRAFSQLGTGIADLFRDPRKVAGREDRNLAYEALQRERPISTMLGESAPYVAGGAGVGAVGRGLGLLRGMAAQGAGSGAIGVGMPGTGGERMARGAVEGLLGAGGEGFGRLATRMVAPGLPGVSREVARDVARAEDLGYQVLPSTRVDSPRLRQNVEGGMEAIPTSAMQFDRVARNNQTLLNRAASESIGEQADEITGEVLGNANARIGQVFEDIAAAPRTVPVDDQLVSDVLRIDEQHIAPLIGGAGDPIGRAVQQTVEMLDRGTAGGGLSTREMMSQISRIGKRANQQMTSATGDRELGMALFDLQDSLLQATQRGLPADDAARLRVARGQYRNLKNLEHGSVVDTGSGNVSPKKLDTLLRRKDKAGYLRKGDVENPLYAATRFLGRQQPNLATSGTAERSYMGRLFNTAVGGAALGGGASATGVSTGDPMTNIAIGAGAGILAPAAMARAYLRPAMSDYLTRQAGPLLGQSMRATGIGGLNTLLGPGSEDRY